MHCAASASKRSVEASPAPSCNGSFLVYPGPIPTDACCPSLITYGILFHPSKRSSLDNKLHGLPRYSGQNISNELKMLGARGQEGGLITQRTRMERNFFPKRSQETKDRIWFPLCSPCHRDKGTETPSLGFLI